MCAKSQFLSKNQIRLFESELQMQRVNEFSFYKLAAMVHPLTDIARGSKFNEIWSDLWQARSEVELIFSLRPLSVCAQAAIDLQAAISQIVPEKWEDLVIPDAATEQALPPWLLGRVETAAKNFETILAAECQVLDTYFVSKKGAYSTADLVEHAHYQIPPALRGSLPSLTKSDIDQAGKCLAFDVPTAAAFHILRGTEATLVKYYETVVPGPKQASAKMRNWGVYLKLLKEHGAEPKITSLIEHLKDAYRNPVLHPEESYTDDRALVLFGVCISAIVMMVQETEILLAKGGLLSLGNPAI